VGRDRFSGENLGRGRKNIENHCIILFIETIKNDVYIKTYTVIIDNNLFYDNIKL